MPNRLLTIAALLCLAAGLNAQTAKSVLDKTAANVSAKSGVTAQFTITGKALGTASGQISVKGRKLHAATPEAVIWFDGKTQWTFMKKNNEVNVSTPTAASLEALNPYNFIYLYKQGYTSTMKAAGGNYEVHLKASSPKKAVQEMYITVSKKTYTPTQVRLLRKGGWTTIDIRNLKKTKLSDSMFTFRAKDYPKAEVIDLR